MKQSSTWEHDDPLVPTLRSLQSATSFFRVVLNTVQPVPGLQPDGLWVGVQRLLHIRTVALTA